MINIKNRATAAVLEFAKEVEMAAHKGKTIDHTTLFVSANPAFTEIRCEFKEVAVDTVHESIVESIPEVEEYKEEQLEIKLGDVKSEQRVEDKPVKRAGRPRKSK